MRVSIVIIALMILASCESKVPSNMEDPAFGWGHLPALESGHFIKSKKCSNKTYVRNFYSAISEKESLHVQGEGVSGISHPFLLGDSCIQAKISTRVYVSENLRSKSYYSIGVEVPIKDSRCETDDAPGICKSGLNSFVEVFSQDFTKEEIGSYFKGKKISEVVFYSEDKKEVVFKINSKEIKYVLPNL